MKTWKAPVIIRMTANGPEFYCQACLHHERGPASFDPEATTGALARFAAGHDRVCPKRPAPSGSMYVLREGAEKAALYSSCNDGSYAQAELLLMAERHSRTNPEDGLLANFDVVDDLPVERFLQAYDGRPDDLRRLHELRREILEKGWDSFVLRVDEGKGDAAPPPANPKGIPGLPFRTPAIGFQDLLAHLDALTERIRGPKGDALPPFKDSHVFYLRELDKINESMDAIGDDLCEELRERVPLPFHDVTLVMQVSPEEPERLWFVVRMVEDQSFFERTKDGQEIMIFHYEIRSTAEHSSPTLSNIRYRGWQPDGEVRKFRMETSPLVVFDDGRFSEAGRGPSETHWSKLDGLLKAAAAVSHPANYIVKVTPRLTPREERQARGGGRSNPAKKPHFIVVDHEVLVSLGPGRRSSDGHHASPVPHHRRGHWKRLAERCRHARLMGKDKVWVRPAYVGETSFSDDKNLYEVLLDFAKKAEVDTP